MTINEIYDYVLNVSNKDVAGQGFSPDQMNNLLKFVNLELFQENVAKAQMVSVQQNVSLSEALISVSDLKNFIKTESVFAGQRVVGTRTIGEVSYPDDYRYPIALTANGRLVETCSYGELSKIIGGVINRNFNERPAAIETDGAFQIIPNDLDELVLTYLKTPTTPYFDYCISSYDTEIFMPVGSYVSYIPQAGVYNLYSSTGVLMEQNVTHSYFEGMTPSVLVSYTSLTTELEWADYLHIIFANRILAKLGVNLRSQEVMAYGLKEESK